LKNVKTPKQRILFRQTALKNLEIHQVFLGFLPCLATNPSLLVIPPFIKQALSKTAFCAKSFFLILFLFKEKECMPKGGVHP
jgi:hypothetical protein